MDNYILDEDNDPVREDDIVKWAEWMEGNRARIVDSTHIGSWRVSTVFLGTDHSFVEGEPPVLFETMVFGGPLDGEQERYYTWDLAEAGHRKMVEKVKAHSVEAKLDDD